MTLRVTQEGWPPGKWRAGCAGDLWRALWLLRVAAHRRARLGAPPGSFVVGMGLCFLPLSFPFRAFLLQPEQLSVTAAPQRLPLRANWIRQGASAGRAEGTA